MGLIAGWRRPIRPSPPGAPPGRPPPHRTRSTDSDVPIDYGAAAVARRIAELAITDHVDFDPRGRTTRRTTPSASGCVRDAAERWALRYGLEVSWESDREDEIRALGRPPVRLRHRLGRITPDSPYHVSRVERWVAGRSSPRTSPRSRPRPDGLFDTLGHLDFVKRYVASHSSRRRSPNGSTCTSRSSGRWSSPGRASE